MRLTDFVEQRSVVREGIEIGQMVPSIRQGVILVLRRDVGEAFRDLFELRERDEPPVDVGSRSSRRCHHPANQELPIGFDALVAQGLENLCLPAQVEKRFDFCGIGVRADHFGPATRSQHQLKRIDQDRLSRAGLTRDDVEPGIELDLERFDDGEAPHAQARQHGASSSTGVAPALHKR